VGTAVALRAKVFGLNVTFYDPMVPHGVERSLGTCTLLPIYYILREAVHTSSMLLCYAMHVTLLFKLCYSEITCMVDVIRITQRPLCDCYLSYKYSECKMATLIDYFHSCHY